MNGSKCPLCSGKFVEGTTSFTVDYQKGLIVVRNVPALICDQCGEGWLKDEISERLEHLVRAAQERSFQLEVIDMAA